jgi:predicted MFS family arabinose efflux permease
MNRRVPSRYRATANSLASFGFRGAFVVTGPIVGHILDLWGITTTVVLLAVGTLGVFLSIIVPLILSVRASERRMTLESASA